MRLDPEKRKILENVAALALHPTTRQGEWEAAAVAFFRVLRNQKTTAEELLSAGYERVVYRDRVVYRGGPGGPDTSYHRPRYTCFGFGKYKGVPFDHVPYSYLAWALKNLQYLSPACRQAIREAMSKDEFNFG